MSYYPPADGAGGGGYPNQNQGFNQGGGGFPQQDPYNQGGGGFQQQGYQQHQQQGGGAYPGGFSQNEGYGQQAYGQQGGGAYPGGFPQNEGGGGGFQEDGMLPGGFRSASEVPEEHLPPGYNPQTRAPYQANELPRGASPAPEGYEGYVPEGMSTREAHERGFIGTAGGGLLGAWLGHKFGKKHGHGFLGSLGGAGLGGFLGGKLL
ncbi:hypothetical protein WJX73_000990 [Symbiochloris irregularis]|uniref:Glycine zipper 2TM domain-containing protein n=1 Tax=Symbiochloris irregularis TaxID=706552 RepID=A0AAW1PCZ2_9CHLO